MAVIRIFEDRDWADTCPIVNGRIQGCSAQLGYWGTAESDSIYDAIETAISRNQHAVKSHGLTFTWEIEYHLKIDFGDLYPSQSEIDKLIRGCGAEYMRRDQLLVAYDVPDAVWCAWKRIRNKYPDAVAFNPERPRDRHGQDSETPPDWLL